MPPKRSTAGKGGKPARAPAAGASQGAGARTGESRKQRIPRLAAAFGAVLHEVVARDCSKDDLRYAWEVHCKAKGEPTSGFGSILYYLVQWGLLWRTGWQWHKVVTIVTRNARQRRPVQRVGARSGTRPPFLFTRFDSPLPKCPLPAALADLAGLEVHQMRAAANAYLERLSLVPKDITPDNYTEYQHAVLFVEELQMKYDIALYDLEVEVPLVRQQNGLYRIAVPGVAEKRPSVLRGDAVLLVCRQGPFEGFVHEVRLDNISVSFHADFQNKPPFSVHFDFSRTSLRAMHRAVDESSDSWLTTVQIRRPDPEPHPKLNEEQRLFVAGVVNPLRYEGPAPARPPPVLLWGPPGTGKTTTVVAAINAVLKRRLAARVLVTAPSNPAADLLCERLAAEGGLTPRQMLRLVAVSRSRKDIAAAVLPYTKYNEVDNAFEVPTLKELMDYKVIVSTCASASYIRSRMPQNGKDARWFDYIFVDEAAQAMEVEVLIPLTLGAKGCRRYFAGDFNQLGPVILSPVATRYGLDKSLMERIKDHITVDHSRVYTLLKSYRAHPSILELYNKPVYAGLLQCCSGLESRDFERWSHCPRDKKGKLHPVIFHNCLGKETRQKDSPSWMNEDELTLVQHYLQLLLVEHRVDPKDIGIISPYHKQCQRLRILCHGEEASEIQVGTTELFQGREKRVIIISTVRSRELAQIGNDLRFSLGFLSNFKRTNVAISRAKSLLIVIGNLGLLSQDEQWNQILRLVSGFSAECLKGPPFELKQVAFRDRGAQQDHATDVHADGDGAVDRPWRDYE